MGDSRANAAGAARAMGASQRTTADLSTECAGFFAPERHGVICRRTTENGDPFISGFVDGGIKAYGRRFSKH